MSNCLFKQTFIGYKCIMVVLGINPGTRITGYGILDEEKKPLDYGCIKPPPNLPLSARYQVLFESLEELIQRYHPEAIAVESQFVLKNAQSAIKLGMAKGMVFLAGARNKTPIYEFAPKQAKLAVVGSGNASKHQVQRMIQALLHLPYLPEPGDAADALALAICCYNHLRTPCTSQLKAN